MARFGLAFSAIRSLVRSSVDGINLLLKLALLSPASIHSVIVLATEGTKRVRVVILRFGRNRRWCWQVASWSRLSDSQSIANEKRKIIPILWNVEGKTWDSKNVFETFFFKYLSLGVTQYMFT